MTTRLKMVADTGYDQMADPSKRGNEFSLF